MHLRKAIYISILFVIYGCKSGVEHQQIAYYPSKSEFTNAQDLVQIDLDTTSLNYWDIFQMTPANDYRKDVPFFEITGSTITKRIVPFLINYPFDKRNEIITITMDSVIADKGYSIHELDNVMKSVFGNQKTSKFYNYQKNPHSIKVAIDIDSASSGRDLRKILLKTTDAFDKLQSKSSDSLALTIHFDILRSLQSLHFNK